VTAQPLLRFALGFLTFIVGVGLSMVVLGSAVLHVLVRPAAWASAVFALLTVLFFLATAYFWFRAIRLAEGDDVLSGERGLLLSLMLVIVIGFAAFVILIVVQPEFWRGVIEGMAAGARDARR
jgi:hypothetical protein